MIDKLLHCASQRSTYKLFMGRFYIFFLPILFDFLIISIPVGSINKLLQFSISYNTHYDSHGIFWCRRFLCGSSI